MQEQRSKQRSIVARLSASRAVVLTAIAVLGLAASALLLYSTPYGIGINSDSVMYIGGANNILAGRGFGQSLGGEQIKPITGWPPFYSIAIAGVELLGLRQEASARWLGAALFAANVIVAGLAAWALTGSGIMALAGAWTILTSASLIYLFSFAMSEPLYLFLSVGGLLLLSAYFRRGEWGHLLGASGLVGLAVLTRYAGVSAVVAGAIGLFFLGHGGRRRRARDAGVFLAITLGPLALWLIRNVLVAGTSTDRQFGFHPPALPALKIPFSLVWRTLMPFEFSYPALWGMVVMLAAVPAFLLLTGRWRGIRTSLQRLTMPLPGRPLILLLAAYATVHACLLVATVTFADVSTPLDDRQMSPLIVVIYLLALAAGYALWRRLDRRFLWQAVAAAAGIALLLSYPAESSNTVRLLRINGGGFAHLGFRNLPMLQAVRELPAGILIYTNERELVYFYTGRGAYSLPTLYNDSTGQASDYQAGLDRMRQDLREHGGVIVVFDSIYHQSNYPPREDVTVGMLTLKEVYGGAIFGYSPLPTGAASRLGQAEPPGRLVCWNLKEAS